MASLPGGFLATAAAGTQSVIAAEVMPEPFSTLAQYGAAGVLAFVLIRLYESVLARERARAEKAEDQRDALTARTMSDVVPLVGEVQRTMVPTIEKLVASHEKLAAEIQQLRSERR